MAGGGKLNFVLIDQMTNEHIVVVVRIEQLQKIRKEAWNDGPLSKAHLRGIEEVQRCTHQRVALRVIANEKNWSQDQNDPIIKATIQSILSIESKGIASMKKTTQLFFMKMLH